MRWQFWTHAHDAAVEDENALRSMWWAGFFLRLAGHAGRSTWIHLSLPAPSIMDGVRMRAREVAVRYRTGATDAWIGAVHVYDGERIIAAHDGLLDASAEWKIKRLNVPGWPFVQHGLGVSMHVVFNRRRESPRDDQAWLIELSSVGLSTESP